MPVASPSADLDVFRAAFEEFVRAAKRARARGSNEDSLTPAQYDLLSPLLGAEDPPGLRELARAAGVAAPTATRMIDGLEARGLVVRTRCISDRRAVRLTLTDEGAAAVRERRKQIRRHQEELFASLSESERAAVTRALRQMATAYDGMYR